MKIAGQVLSVDAGEFVGERGPVQVITYRVEDHTAKSLTCRQYPRDGEVRAAVNDVVEAVVGSVSVKSTKSGSYVTFNVRDLVVVASLTVSSALPWAEEEFSLPKGK